MLSKTARSSLNLGVGQRTRCSARHFSPYQCSARAQRLDHRPVVALTFWREVSSPPAPVPTRPVADERLRRLPCQKLFAENRATEYHGRLFRLGDSANNIH